MTENRRRGARSQRPKTRDVISEQLPFGQPQMRFEPLRAVSEDELEAIHQSSLKLSETGINFLDETARTQLADAGAEVEGERVRFDPELVMSLISTAPEKFVMHGLTPERNVVLGGNLITNTLVASPPFVTGLGETAETEIVKITEISSRWDKF